MVAVANFQARRGYRLPTVPEWQYAARAGTTTDRYFGQELTHIDDYVWHRNNSSNGSKPVGLLRPNDFGLFDVIGNVTEWCYNPSPKPHGNCTVCQPGRSSDQCKMRFETLSGKEFNARAEDQCVYNLHSHFNNVNPTSMSAYAGFRVVKNEP